VIRRLLAPLALAAVAWSPARAPAAALPDLIPGGPTRPVVAAPAVTAATPAVPAQAAARPDAVGDGVRLAPATPGSVRFTVSVAAPAIAPAPGDDGSVSVTLDGYDALGAPGTPPLLRRVINIAVPPLGAVRLNAVASGLTSRDDVLLAPVTGEDRKGVTVSGKRPRAYAAAGSPSPVGARLLEVSWIRNQRVARIAIEPAAYEPSRRRLTVASRIDIDVEVQPLGTLGPPAEPDDPFEPVYQATLLNYAQGRA
jgi:hypothetical protein